MLNTKFHQAFLCDRDTCFAKSGVIGNVKFHHITENTTSILGLFTRVLTNGYVCTVRYNTIACDSLESITTRIVSNIKNKNKIILVVCTLFVNYLISIFLHLFLFYCHCIGSVLLPFLWFAFIVNALAFIFLHLALLHLEINFSRALCISNGLLLVIQIVH